ncbi:MAG TPA: GSCFA domain-containing protein, partial [Adhaeribacter sp.]|nr:GSCFA domain-containing protein [Adhaeribacter sp.]
MIFRTELHLAPATTQFNLAANVVTVGSCFSEVIGHQLETYKVNTLTNPFGTIFNPLSACKLLQICAGADVELADAFVENNGRWFSYDFHSSFSAPTEEELYEQLDEALVKTRRFLKKADLLIITLGTANVFRLNITGETVANCHKLPASNFTRETLQPEEIITAIAETHSLLRELNPNLRIILSVSPVRHLKDTLELNSVSKAILRLATHFLSQQLPGLDYFPAYELLLDDLRDYRFYKEDMLHPTQVAEKYIWEKFSQVYFDQAFQTFSADWDTILRAMAHKPFHPESAAHQAFVQKTLEKLKALSEKTDVTEQLAYFESQVIIPPVLAVEEDEEADEDEAETTAETDEEAATIILPENAQIMPEVIPEAALAETTVPAITPEEARKKKKKNRKKKKKPFGQAEGEVAGEAGETATEATGGSEQAETAQTHEPALTAEAGAGTTEVADEEEKPLPLSKSAKKRANRRKKKGLQAREVIPAADAATPETPAAGAGRTLETEYGFSTGKEMPVQVQISDEAAVPNTTNAHAAAAKNDVAGIPAAASSRPIKPARKRPERQPTESIAEPAPAGTNTEPAGSMADQEPKVPENTGQPETGEKQNQPPTVQQPAAEQVQEKATTATEKPAAKRPSKSRKPKMPPLFREEAEPVVETIAVPFVPAAALEETVESTAAQPAEEKPKRGKAKGATRKKPTASQQPSDEITPATPETPEAAATIAKNKDAEVSAGEPEKRKKPAARKPAAKTAPAKPKTARTKAEVKTKPETDGSSKAAGKAEVKAKAKPKAKPGTA